MSSIGKTIGLCLGFITIVVVMFVYSVTREPQLSDEEMRAQGVFLLPKPRDIAPFSLETVSAGDDTNQNQSAQFTNADLQGKWSFIFFGFTHCPDVCPTSMAVMGQVDTALRQAGIKREHDFQGVLISVDPERDTADKVAAYAQAFSPRFAGVVGPREDLAELAQQVNVAFAKLPDGSGGYTMDHTGHIVVINPMGHYHGFIKLPHKAETIRLTYQTLAARF